MHYFKGPFLNEKLTGRFPEPQFPSASFKLEFERVSTPDTQSHIPVLPGHDDASLGYHQTRQDGWVSSDK